MDKTDRLRDYGLAFLLYEQGLGLCGYELIRELFIFVKLILNSYLSIYIKHNDFKVFEMHVYDADRKCFLNAANGFDFCLSTNRPLHYKKIKDIFKNNNPGVIVCRYCRLDKLNNELINNDSLIF